MSRALNHEGDKGRTQVKRALVTDMQSLHHHGAHVGHRPGLNDDLHAGLFGVRCLTVLPASTLTHLPRQIAESGAFADQLYPERQMAVTGRLAQR